MKLKTLNNKSKSKAKNNLRRHNSLIIFSTLALIIIFVGIVLYQVKQIQRRNFLSQLKGEVVFVRRNADGVADIWKINANGNGEKMLFHNNLNDFKTDSRSPQWSPDGQKIYFISFNKNKEQIVYQMNSDGKNLQPIEKRWEYKLDDVTHWSREPDIFVRQGDIYILNNQGQQIKVFNHPGYYNQDYSPGAFEASWSPDKQYIIFEHGGWIMVADRHGQAVKLTRGGSPDWKY